MRNTSITRKLRAFSVALAIFAIGAGIGWQVAGLLFPSEPPTPIVASIQFEGSQRHDAFRRDAIVEQGQEAVRAPVPAPQQAAVEPLQQQPAVVAKQSDEERRFTEGVEWADKYRQRRAAAEWEAVAKHQQEMQRLALAQGLQMQQHISDYRKLADAGTSRPQEPTAEKVADRNSAPAKPRVRSARKQNRAAKRVGHLPRARMNRASGERAGTLFCPLQWLWLS